MKITLPFPPSVNSLYSTDWKTKRRFKSKRYAEWSSTCKTSLFLQRANGLSGFLVPVKISLQYGRPDKRRRDLDGLFKAVFDLLVEMRFLEDDSLIHEIYARWGGKPGYVEIEIEAL